jgi:hypothetical protein
LVPFLGTSSNPFARSIVYSPLAIASQVSWSTTYTGRTRQPRFIAFFQPSAALSFSENRQPSPAALRAAAAWGRNVQQSMRPSALTDANTRTGVATASGFVTTSSP